MPGGDGVRLVCGPGVVSRPSFLRSPVAGPTEERSPVVRSPVSVRARRASRRATRRASRAMSPGRRAGRGSGSGWAGRFGRLRMASAADDGAAPSAAPARRSVFTSVPVPASPVADAVAGPSWPVSGARSGSGFASPFRSPDPPPSPLRRPYRDSRCPSRAGPVPPCAGRRGPRHRGVAPGRPRVFRPPSCPAPDLRSHACGPPAGPPGLVGRAGGHDVLRRETRSDSSRSVSSVRADSPEPRIASARARLASSISAMRSSIVPSVIRRWTWTGWVWPMR
ncbi:hypothetical protein SHIRM173S_11237 [Streptomyces hirsutus]